MKAEDANGLSAAISALAEWDLEVQSLDLISVSENEVFKVTTSHGVHYAVRVHRPGYNSIRELESEQAWVTALDDGGLGVPRAVPTRSGSGYAEATAADGTTRQVGVIEWVSGSSMADLIDEARADTTTVSLHEDLGARMAMLHNHAASWNAPDGFTRRRWDVEGLLGDAPHWGCFWNVDSLTPAENDLFERARVRLRAEFESFGTAPDRFGLIHADLHPWNVLMSPRGLVVIDFDDCGYGWHIYDLAVAMYYPSSDANFDVVRDAMVAGYRRHRSLPDDHLNLLGVFVLMRGLALIGWRDARPLAPFRLEDLIDQECRRAERYLA